MLDQVFDELIRALFGLVEQEVAVGRLLEELVVRGVESPGEVSPAVADQLFLVCGELGVPCDELLLLSEAYWVEQRRFLRAVVDVADLGLDVSDKRRDC